MDWFREESESEINYFFFSKKIDLLKYRLLNKKSRYHTTGFLHENIRILPDNRAQFRRTVQFITRLYIK